MLQSVWRPAFRPVMSSPFETAVAGDPLLRAVRELFANGEEGALYYFTPDFAGLYQDAAGTTPVTATAQPVGLMLDRRFGLDRGPNISPVFGPSWSLGEGWSVTDGRAVANSGATSNMSIEPGLEHSKTYEVVFTVDEISAGRLRVILGGGVSFTAWRNSAGTFSEFVTVRPTGPLTLFLQAEFGTSGAVSFLSVREVPGNHASQTTTTARPTLRSGPLRIDYDGVDDYLRTVFPDLGSDVTIARSIPGTGAQILTGQTIAAGNWDDNVTSCATLVIDRALAGPETALVTAFLDQQAGV